MAAFGEVNGIPFSVNQRETMKNTKLARLLRRLSDPEVDEFGAYLRAFYAGEEAPLALFEQLRLFHPNFEAEQLEKSQLAVRLGLRTRQSGKRISNLASQLYGRALDFLAWRKFLAEENKFDYYRLAMEAAREKKLEQEFFQLSCKAEAWLEEAPAGAWRPMQRLRLAHYRYYYTPAQKWQTENRPIEEAAIELQYFSYTAGLKYYCELKSRALAMQEKGGELETYRPAENASIESAFAPARLYALCAQLLDNDTDENYESFYRAFMARAEPLDKEDEHILLGYLINAVARRVPADEKRWAPRAFHLYQHGLERNILITDGYLSDSTFHNIVHLACALQELEWADRFVQTYAGLLVEDGRASTINLALARIAFERSDFDRTLELLMGLEFKNYPFAIQAKLLRVRCYYEKGEGLAFESLLKSYDAFLSRNKVVNKEATLAAFRNFLKILRLMAGGNHSRSQLEQAIGEQDHLVCRHWLEHKVQSLPE